MGFDEDSKIKNILESQYIDSFPPRPLKVKILGTIEFLSLIKELALLYSAAPLSILDN